MSEITDTGYIVKTQNEWFSEEQELYTGIDRQWNLDPSTPDGLKIAHDAEIFGNLDEVLQTAYNSKNPNAATGYDLDVLSAITGTIRDLGTGSTATVTVSGVEGTRVGSGIRIQSTQDQTIWLFDEETSIPSSGSIDVGVTCETLGAISADAGSISIILDTVPGLRSVTNAAAAVAGTPRQNDAQLRLVRNQQVGLPGNNQVDSLLSAIFTVTGVVRATVYENATGSAAVHPENNPHGLPAHSVTILVDGGDETEIAQAIFSKRNPGTLQNQEGTAVTRQITSSIHSSNSAFIRYGRPSNLNITISVNITDVGGLPGSIEDLLTEAIIDYSSGNLLDQSCGFNPLGFNIGEDVPASRIYTPINSVLGQYGNSYVSELLVNGSSDNVEVDFDQLARFDESRIVITITT